jgi:Xaa-Pro dipeptidase
MLGLPKELAFPIPEYHERVRRGREMMHKRGLDLLLVHHPPNLFYLSGYQCVSMYIGECLVLTREGDLLLLVPGTELGSAMLHSWVEQRFSFARDEHPMEVLARVLHHEGLAGGRIGIEETSAAVSAEKYGTLRRALRGSELVDGSGTIEAVKRVKSPSEVDYLRRAAAISKVGMEAAIGAVAERATDNDVAAAAYRAMIAAGSEYMCWAPVVTTGRRSSVMHSTHKRISLERGDAVDIELGGCYQRYSGPIMRTASVGEPTDGVKRLADICLRVLESLLATMRPGITADEVARVGWARLELAAPDEFFHGNFAYAVGAGFPPTWADGTGVIRSGSQTRLEPGMVFHLPIAIRALGRFGVMFSETVLITETGCEPLTDVARRLFAC